MKNKKIIATVLASVSILAGCVKNDNEKVTLFYKDQSLERMIEFTSEDDLVETLIDTKKNFILAATGDPNCNCWDTLKFAVINPFVKDTKIPVYGIDLNIMSKDYLGIPVNRNLTNTPILTVFEEGKIKFSITYPEDREPFNSRAKFEAWLDRYINRPIMTHINLDQLNVLLRGTSPFLLNWHLDICPDCKVLDEEYMPIYLKENKITQKIPYYIIETRYIRNPSDPSIWQNVKDNYGLTNKYNTAYGYSTGFVPTLQIIEPDGTDYIGNNQDISPIITDMLVFQNESIVKDGNVYRISESYFNGVRATKYLGNYESEIGKVVSNDIVMETDNGPKLISNSRSELHLNYAKKFLDHYWK